MIRKLVIICGPTGVGKSNVAVKLAELLRSSQWYNSEIINADSMQLYNELPILTAQPNKQDLASVSHHLYSVISPTEQTNVVEWNKNACNLIDKLQEANVLPIVVGGTGFYISSLTVGIPQAPKVTQEIRDYTKRTLEILGRDRFYNQLLSVDREIEYKIQKNDTQRILRAYEVFVATGRSILTFNNKTNFRDFAEIYPFVITMDNAINTKMINTRLLTMVKNGVLEEIESYNKRFGNLQSPLNNALGYKEFSQHIAGNISLGDAVSAVSLSTKKYAKRQRTWFRHKLDHSKYIDIDGTADAVINAAKKIQNILLND